MGRRLFHGRTVTRWHRDPSALLSLDATHMGLAQEALLGRARNQRSGLRVRREDAQSAPEVVAGALSRAFRSSVCLRLPFQSKAGTSKSFVPAGARFEGGGSEAYCPREGKAVSRPCRLLSSRRVVVGTELGRAQVTLYRVKSARRCGFDRSVCPAHRGLARRRGFQWILGGSSSPLRPG